MRLCGAPAFRKLSRVAAEGHDAASPRKERTLQHLSRCQLFGHTGPDKSRRLTDDSLCICSRHSIEGIVHENELLPIIQGTAEETCISAPAPLDRRQHGPEQLWLCPKRPDRCLHVQDPSPAKATRCVHILPSCFLLSSLPSSLPSGIPIP